MKDSGQLAVLTATIEAADGNRIQIWYSMPVHYKFKLTEGAEPFVLATIFTAMRQSTDLVVHGDVSPSLLRNLSEYQGAWACWCPRRYTRIEILADTEQEQPAANVTDGAISAFSGGVDSCFTVFRHRARRAGRLTRNLLTSVMVQGCDISIDQPEVFQRALARSGKMLTSLGVELIPVASNFRELDKDWVHSHAALVASCLWLFSQGYSSGLIPSTEPYDDLVLPWGSNPVTDWLLSSDSFRIIHDGAAFTRNEKVREIANWPEATRYLRVCWEGNQLDQNCGKCEKCIRTILNFRVMGFALPECFENDVNEQEILHLTGLNQVSLANFKQILSVAERTSISESWVSALDRCVKRNQQALERGPSFRQRIKQSARNHLVWLRNQWQGELSPRT
jgi:hypothetical protein